MSGTIGVKVNPDLINERKNATFDVEELARWWNGGVEALADKRKMENIFLNDPELKDVIPSSYLSHKELYEENVRKTTTILNKIRKLTKENNKTFNDYISAFAGTMSSGILKGGNPIGLHFAMFLPTLVGQATREQQQKWLTRAMNLEIIGTYAQTELGHGTFIRGLETRATYDPKTQEFVLNSPTITAYKWWPGGLGHSSNYATVIAQLYTNNQCHGIHPFMVQLRDEETWAPLPGIDIGEIGPKLGMKAVNNGYLGFKNVRIPRTNMLMKNSQVLEDGTYVKSPSNVLTYGTMVFVRVVIIRDVTNYLSKASTIVTRYSAVRRQSPIDPSKPEPQVLDHVTQQLKVFPNIAKTFVFKLAADYIWKEYTDVTSELNSGNLKRLPEFHALTCCLKAVCTADGAAAIETLRLACGGHGFMEASDLPTIYGMVTASCTYEGENTVLLLQTARYLLKSWDNVIAGKNLTPTVAYLSVGQSQQKQKWNFSLQGIITSLQIVAANKVRLAYESVQKHKKQGLNHEDAVNQSSILLVAAADAHCRAFLVQSAYEMTKPIGQNVSSCLANVISNLIELYAIDTSTKAIADLIRFAGLTESDVQQLQLRLEHVLKEIRPNAVAIVDGFDIHDSVLSSALGAYDGNVYERLFAEAKKSPLNQEPVNKSFHLYLKPFMQSNL